MGGVGEIHAETLARLGIGKLTIADGDTFELANINRQMEASLSTVGKDKAEVLRTTLKDINPYLDIRVSGYVTPETIDTFLEDADIVVDGIDFFEIDIRRALFNKACARGIPVITAAPIGFGSSVIVFTKDSMSFDDYFMINDTTKQELKPLLFGIGLAPALLQRAYFAPEKIKTKSHIAPSSVLGTLAAADWMGVMVCKLLDNQQLDVAPVSFHFDPYVAKMKRTHLYFGNRNILQRIKIWYLTKILLKK
jgi:molybdopterin/thiamine biosynthesis adenylyltransferase